MSFLKNAKSVVDKLKARFLISGRLAPYLPERAIDYRYPAPVYVHPPHSTTAAIGHAAPSPRRAADTPSLPTDPAPLSCVLCSDQPKPMIPRTSPEKGFDTTYFARQQMKGTPYDAGAAYDETPLAPGEMPHHIPAPVWFNEKDMTYQIEKYAKVGYMPAGKYYDHEREADAFVPSYLDHGYYSAVSNRLRPRPVLVYAEARRKAVAHAERIREQHARWQTAAGGATAAAAQK